jgi:hypothetical protein
MPNSLVDGDETDSGEQIIEELSLVIRQASDIEAARLEPEEQGSR